jgi:hypothetical protein
VIVVHHHGLAAVVARATIDLEAVANRPDPPKEEERDCHNLEDAPYDAHTAVLAEDSVDDGT